MHFGTCEMRLFYILCTHLVARSKARHTASLATVTVRTNGYWPPSSENNINDEKYNNDRVNNNSNNDR